MTATAPRKRIHFSVGQFLLAFVMIAFTLTILVPLLHLIARSVSDPSVSPGMSGLSILPQKLNFINYRIVLSNPVLLPSIGNSIYITVVGTALNIVLTTMGAYALTRPGLIGKPVIMGFLIVMMLVDPGLVPEYFTVKDLGLMGSQWSVILSLAVNVYYLIILMRYFEEVPSSIFEAARMDGAGHWRTLASIAVPLAKVGVATIAMFYAVVRWNEYLRSGIYISTIRKTTMQVILRKFAVLGDIASIIGHQNVLNYNEFARVDYVSLQYAAILVSLVPILCIYPLALKYFQKGILSGGIKE